MKANHTPKRLNILSIPDPHPDKSQCHMEVGIWQGLPWTPSKGSELLNKSEGTC